MTRNWSNSSDRLANVARAAGFAMATPDDSPEEAAPARTTKLATTASWTPASPERALVVATPRPGRFQTTLRDWVAALTWRAPA